MVPPRLLKSPAGCNKRPPSPQSNSLNLTPTQPGAGHTLCPPSPQSNSLNLTPTQPGAGHTLCPLPRRATPQAARAALRGRGATGGWGEWRSCFIGIGSLRFSLFLTLRKPSLFTRRVAGRDGFPAASSAWMGYRVWQGKCEPLLRLPQTPCSRRVKSKENVTESGWWVQMKMLL